MPNFVPVSRDSHARKRWLRSENHSFAANELVVPLVGAELGRALPAMPMAFVEQGGRYTLVALLSLLPPKNLFVTPDGKWLGSYVPAALRSYPFRLMRREGTTESVLMVDEASGLVAEADGTGELFFDEAGNPSTAVKAVLDFLTQVERNRTATELAVAALASAGVIRPWDIKVKTETGEQPVNGLHRIDEAAMNALSDEAFARLRKAAALPIAYGQLFSMGQLGVFAHLARLQAQLAQAVPVKAPSLDDLFGTAQNDILRFH